MKRILVDKAETDGNDIRLVVRNWTHALEVFMPCSVKDVKLDLVTTMLDNSFVLLKHSWRLHLRELFCAVRHDHAGFANGPVAYQYELNLLNCLVFIRPKVWYFALLNHSTLLVVSGTRLVLILREPCTGGRTGACCVRSDKGVSRRHFIRWRLLITLLSVRVRGSHIFF